VIRHAQHLQMTMLLAQGPDTGPLEPFNPGLLLIAGAAAVIAAFIAIDRYQQHRMDERIRAKKLEEKEADEARLKAMITEIVTAAFTGRAEADHLLRNDLLRQIKDAQREALDEHAKDERRYIDGLRDKISEYHATSLTAIGDAKRVALHVSAEYNAIKARLSEIEQQLVLIKKELDDHDHGSE
jgi:hypothetical protein